MEAPKCRICGKKEWDHVCQDGPVIVPRKSDVYDVHSYDVVWLPCPCGCGVEVEIKVKPRYATAACRKRVSRSRK